MAAPLEPGLHERIVTAALRRALAELAATPSVRAELRALEPAEAADRLGLLASRLLSRFIDDAAEGDKVTTGAAIVRHLARHLVERSGEDAWLDDAPTEPAQVLRAIAALRPDGTPATPPLPATPLLDTTLLTNAHGEPRMVAQVLSEIPSAARIDLVMAFVRRTGVRPLIDALRQHCTAGRPLRVLTTTYTGSTERAALEELVALGADVRVSYDVGATRLHAKAWLFDRGPGVSTVYVGSSNLTHAGQHSGQEWNVRASSARNAPLVDKVRAVFDSHWASDRFEPFDARRFDERIAAQTRPARAAFVPATELRLEPFQERLLEEIGVARRAGHRANLLVAATGTGKTVMAAVDFRRLEVSLTSALGRPPRLLFIAHRKEILEQARSTYAHALRRPDFGEEWYEGRTPTAWNAVFASVATLARADAEHLAPDHFDVVVVDEFHHAAADSYARILARLRPQELLGLTATPERADGRSVLEWFGGRIAAELRVWDAIEQQRLVPFEYYGVHDGTDLRAVGWTRGRGYDTDELTNVYTQDDRWAREVLDAVSAHVDDPLSMRALGFCVSVAHAEFMALRFTSWGIPAAAVSGATAAEERREALRRLSAGDLQVVFSVDLFNEGVDVPRVDTLLMLRPTESGTLFLQQLGRGLRRADGKASCLVLDFVGRHRREFRYDLKLRALVGGTRRELEKQLEAGFPFLPAGCHLGLDRLAAATVLRSIRSALPTTHAARAAELRAQARESGDASLGAFLRESGLELEDIYASGRSWSDLREAAGLGVAAEGAKEGALRRAVGRLLHVDDPERIDAWTAHLSGAAPPPSDPTSRSARLLRMLTSQLLGQALPKTATLAEGLAVLGAHPQVRAELLDLLPVLRERIDHLHHTLRGHPDVPLQVHARYTRLEILAAFVPEDRGKVGAWQTGVRHVPEAAADLLAFTLDKSTSGFSPTTRYRDYALSPRLIHWESQSVVREESDTGQRYQHHVQRGGSIHLFARENAHDRAFWYLGPATYVEHRGERPMAIQWRLEHDLPGDLYARFAAAVA